MVEQIQDRNEPWHDAPPPSKRPLAPDHVQDDVGILAWLKVVAPLQRGQPSGRYVALDGVGRQDLKAMFGRGTDPGPDEIGLRLDPRQVRRMRPQGEPATTASERGQHVLHFVLAEHAAQTRAAGRVQPTGWLTVGEGDQAPRVRGRKRSAGQASVASPALNGSAGDEPTAGDLPCFDLARRSQDAGTLSRDPKLARGLSQRHHVVQ